MARLRTFHIARPPLPTTAARYHASASPYSSRPLAIPNPNANPSSSHTNWASPRHSLSLQPQCLILQSLSLGQHSIYRGCRSFTTGTRAAAPIIAIKVPQMAESISEGTLSSLLKGIGDRVEVDEEIASIETDKVDVAINTPEAGVVVEICVGEGDVVGVDQVACRVDIGMDAERKSTGEAESSGSGEEIRESAPLQKATRFEESERKALESQQLYNSTVRTTPAAQPSAASLVPETSAPPTSNLKVPDVPTLASSPSSPSPASNRPKRTETRIKMTRLRSTIAARLKVSQNRAAALTTFNEVDMSALITLRQRHRASVLDAHGVRLGFMGAFAKASALALREVPAVNAGIEGEGLGNTIVWRDFVDISFAVSTEKGLVTPVLRNCESLSLLEMEKGIAALAEKACLGKITMQDLQGGNLTISNGGVFGSLMGTPIINLPQTAVLGLHGIKERPVVVDGKVEIRPMMYLALTYDHRLLDGREGTTFLASVKKYIEDPTAMLFQ